MNLKSNVYVIRDLLKEGFGVPFVQDNDDVARRMFNRLLADPESDVHASPADFQLIRIATYDFRSGMIESQDHVLIASGSKAKA